ncbi:hypothetical protein [Helicobacter canis]|uniref:hypothetical protein n=1 Tax=Helicobacter canis TaxID=29419 RepID=UPI00054E3945|nr:hypothetical protein [Helicobacter canis]
MVVNCVLWRENAGECKMQKCKMPRVNRPLFGRGERGGLLGFRGFACVGFAGFVAWKCVLYSS